MPFDVTRLNNWLNSSKTQTTNNPLWQLLKAVVGFIQENSEEIIRLHTAIPTDGADPNTVLHGADDPRFRQIATEDVFDAAITEAKIATDAVTTVKILDDAVTTAKILDANVTYAKIQDVSAASKLLGRGSAAGAGDVEELTLGTNLSMSGTTLNATGGGGTVTGSGTTGSIAQWSAATALTDVNAAGISAALDLLP